MTAKPPTWSERVARALKAGRFTPDDVRDAWPWATDPTSELDIERTPTGQPADLYLFLDALSFTKAVEDAEDANGVRAAANLLKAIQARPGEIRRCAPRLKASLPAWL